MDVPGPISQSGLIAGWSSGAMTLEHSRRLLSRAQPRAIASSGVGQRGKRGEEGEREREWRVPRTASPIPRPAALQARDRISAAQERARQGIGEVGERARATGTEREGASQGGGKEREGEGGGQEGGGRAMARGRQRRPRRGSQSLTSALAALRTAEERAGADTFHPAPGDPAHMARAMCATKEWSRDKTATRSAAFMLHLWGVPALVTLVLCLAALVAGAAPMHLRATRVHGVAASSSCTPHLPLLLLRPFRGRAPRSAMSSFFGTSYAAAGGQGPSFMVGAGIDEVTDAARLGALSKLGLLPPSGRAGAVPPTLLRPGASLDEAMRHIATRKIGATLRDEGQARSVIPFKAFGCYGFDPIEIIPGEAVWAVDELAATACPAPHRMSSAQIARARDNCALPQNGAFIVPTRVLAREIARDFKTAHNIVRICRSIYDGRGAPATMQPQFEELTAALHGISSCFDDNIYPCHIYMVLGRPASQWPSPDEIARLMSRDRAEAELVRSELERKVADAQGDDDDIIDEDGVDDELPRDVVLSAMYDIVRQKPFDTLYAVTAARRARFLGFAESVERTVSNDATWSHVSPRSDVAMVNVAVSGTTEQAHRYWLNQDGPVPAGAHLFFVLQRRPGFSDSAPRWVPRYYHPTRHQAYLTEGDSTTVPFGPNGGPAKAYVAPAVYVGQLLDRYMPGTVGHTLQALGATQTGISDTYEAQALGLCTIVVKGGL